MANYSQAQKQQYRLTLKNKRNARNNNNNNKPGKHSTDSLQKNSCTKNITHYKESAAIRNLKPEWWGSPLVQEEKYQENPVKIE
jgi:hypothetical protein